MVLSEFRAEIESFFEIRFAGSQFSTDGKVSAPGTPAPVHSNLELCVQILSEKPAAQLFQMKLKLSIDFVPELPRDPNLASETPTRKVAIRFLDGEVLRGHLDGTLERHRYGVVLHLHAEQADSPIRKLGIPFSAVKALFFIREFDARGEDAGTASDAYLARRTMAPLLDVLEEMDMLTRLHRDGLLSDDEYASKRTLVLERL